MVTTQYGSGSKLKGKAVTTGGRGMTREKGKKTRKRGESNVNRCTGLSQDRNNSYLSIKTKRMASSPSPSRSCNPTVFTIGHGTRSLQELINILQSANVRKLVDVRSIPRSRTNPQFNREQLLKSVELQAAQIRYSWFGSNLGGRRKKQQPGVERHTAIRVASFRNYAGHMCSKSFREGLEMLKNLADEVERTEKGSIAIMCSETLWWRCHRRMISDALVIGGREVRHLGIQKEPMVHKVWDIARAMDDGELIYDGV
ncbi:hypothetical protein DTO013F2_9441 [Penicillium roqueforti]|nr:hypothetical protein DTO013F2_9441 [Penicillium roqueforti]